VVKFKSEIMKKLAYILLLSLPFLGAGCQQNSNGDTGQGHGAQNPQYSEDRQTGAGRVEETGMGPGVSNDGGTMNNTTSTGDTMHTPGAVGATDADKAAEKTQAQQGNSQSRGEANKSGTRPENAQNPKSSPKGGGQDQNVKQ
jgi:hypothetical protein